MFPFKIYNFEQYHSYSSIQTKNDNNLYKLAQTDKDNSEYSLLTK